MGIMAKNRCSKINKKFEKEVEWFSKNYGLSKSSVRKKLKKDGFICN